MANTIQLELKGVAEALNKLKNYEISSVKDIRKQVGKSGLKIESGAKQNAPVDTGRLRASLNQNYWNSGMTVEVGTAVKYAPYLEFGTGELVDIPEGAEDYASKFKGKGVRTINRAPQPFLFPAWEEESRNFINQVKKILNL